MSTAIASAKGSAAAAGQGVNSARSTGNPQQGAAAVSLSIALPAADSCCPSLSISERVYGCMGCFALGSIIGFIGWLQWNGVPPPPTILATDYLLLTTYYELPAPPLYVYTPALTSHLDRPDS